METSSVMTFEKQLFQHRGIPVKVENDVLVFCEQRIKGLHIRSINQNQREKIEWEFGGTSWDKACGWCLSMSNTIKSVMLIILTRNCGASFFKILVASTTSWVVSAPIPTKMMSGSRPSSVENHFLQDKTQVNLQFILFMSSTSKEGKSKSEQPNRNSSHGMLHGLLVSQKDRHFVFWTHNQVDVVLCCQNMIESGQEAVSIGREVNSSQSTLHIQ